MLDIANLSVSYDGSLILRGVNLHAPASKVVCLMGRNGVGKSTTLKSTVGLVKPDEGVIKLDGEVISGMRPDVRARKGLGYVPQGREIFPHLTVQENLKIGLVANGIKANGKTDRVFELFPVLKEMLNRKGGVLSGGQQQQLAIARAVLTEPKVLILDEPTEGIQPNIIDQIGDTIKLLREEGEMTILLVEQYLDFAQELADIFYIMDRGRIVAEGPIEELTDSVVKTHLTV